MAAARRARARPLCAGRQAAAPPARGAAAAGRLRCGREQPLLLPATLTSSRGSRACACSEGTGEETGGEIWDPLDISGAVGDEALMWFRASELKHGRVAMLASVGFLFQEHYTFTGIDSPSYVSFEQPGLAGGLWLGLAVMLGNVEGKSVESFMPLDGGIVAEQNESRLFRIKEDHAWISAENNRSHAIDASASARWRGVCVLTTKIPRAAPGRPRLRPARPQAYE